MAERSEAKSAERSFASKYLNFCIFDAKLRFALLALLRPAIFSKIKMDKIEHFSYSNFNISALTSFVLVQIVESIPKSLYLLHRQFRILFYLVYIFNRWRRIWISHFSRVSFFSESAWACCSTKFLLVQLTFYLSKKEIEGKHNLRVSYVFFCKLSV